MEVFFETRLDGYEEHMLNSIESARKFHAFAVKQLPDTPGTHILSLGPTFILKAKV